MCRGKAAGRGLQDLMAQVRKLRVSSFIVLGRVLVEGDDGEVCVGCVSVGVWLSVEGRG